MPAYRARHDLPLAHLQVMRAIETCRTAVLGGHVERCGHCAHERISYNSCRNRHCPQCQTLAKQQWLQQRMRELLPMEYFHVVFTVPPAIAEMALQNKKTVFQILFRTRAETLLTIAGDPKHLGARVGFFSILHTWGQNRLFRRLFLEAWERAYGQGDLQFHGQLANLRDPESFHKHLAPARQTAWGRVC